MCRCNAFIARKKDKDIVLIAIKQHGYALEHADDELKKDKDIVLAAVENYVATKEWDSALEFVDDSLKEDEDIKKLLEN